VSLLGIQSCHKVLPGVPQVAVFDTSFHHTLEPHAFLYAIPYQYYESKGIRKYGFHGTSHYNIAHKTAHFMGRNLEDLKLISLHLGNGCSVCAIKNGKSIDTSMGVTPLEGLVMGTRSGDIDPSVVFLLKEDPHKVESMLNKESGLKGFCETSDMREILKMLHQGKTKEKQMAKLALDVFCYRIKKYIGAYLVVLGGVDAIMFSAGIGENALEVREEVCKGLDCIGVILDLEKNKQKKSSVPFEIHSDQSKIKVMVVPTEEELQIAYETKQCIPWS